MEIHYDPLLTEAVVLQEICRRQEAGDPTLFREYHVAADPLYHRRPEARNAAFQGLHEQFFNTLGFPDSCGQNSMNSLASRVRLRRSL